MLSVVGHLHMPICLFNPFINVCFVKVIPPCFLKKRAILSMTYFYAVNKIIEFICLLCFDTIIIYIFLMKEVVDRLVKARIFLNTL